MTAKMDNPDGRPFQVTVLGWLFIAIGSAALAYHLATAAMDRWMILIATFEIAGILGGIFLPRGASWARWLILAWLAAHVYSSGLSSVSAALPHLVLLLVVGYFLLGPAAYYFKASRRR